MRYWVGNDTIWEETGKVRVINYPASEGTFSSVSRVYREMKVGSPGWREVQGPVMYFDDMTREQVAFATIMGDCQNMLDKICRRDKFLGEVKDDEI